MCVLHKTSDALRDISPIWLAKSLFRKFQLYEWKRWIIEDLLDITFSIINKQCLCLISEIRAHYTMRGLDINFHCDVHNNKHLKRMKRLTSVQSFQYPNRHLMDWYSILVTVKMILNHYFFSIFLHISKIKSF